MDVKQKLAELDIYLAERGFERREPPEGRAREYYWWVAPRSRRFIQVPIEMIELTPLEYLIKDIQHELDSYTRDRSAW